MALHYDGSTRLHYGSSGLSALDGIQTMTVTYWVYVATGSSSTGHVTRRNADSEGFFIGSPSSNTGIGLYSDGTNFANAAGAITLDTWYFIAHVYNGAGATNADRYKLYSNRVAQTPTFTGTIPATLAAPASAAVLNVMGDTKLGTAVTGNAANVCIWTRLLTQDETDAQMFLAYPVSQKGLFLWSLQDQTTPPDYGPSQFAPTFAVGATTQASTQPPIAYPQSSMRSLRNINRRSIMDRRNGFRRLAAHVPLLQNGLAEYQGRGYGSNA